MAFTSAPSPRSRPFGSTVGGSWSTTSRSWEAMRHDTSGPFDRRPTRGWFPTTSSETPRFSIWPPPPAALKPSMTMTAAAPSGEWGWRPPAQSTASSSIAGFGATPPVSAPTPAPPASSVGFDFSSLRANSTASMHVSPAPPALSGSVAHGDGVRFGFAGVDSKPDATNEAARVAAVDDQPFGSGNTGDGLKPSMTMTAAAPSEGWGWRPPAQSTASSSIAGFGATPPVSAPTPAPPAPSVGFDFSSLRANSTASMHVSSAPPALSDSVAHGDGVRFGFAGVDSEPDATNEAARVAAVDDQPFGSGNTGDGLLERTVQEALVGGSLQAATAHGDEEIPTALSPPRASAGGSRSAAFVRRTPAPRLGRHRGPIVVDTAVETAVETAVAGTQDAPEDAQDNLRDYDL
ncbi:hypothetical protein ATCC90586_009626 [Pythium insidiosum]|nr:hypothetical protein ATCC90586_009626 [Pythium insidiosum]